MKKWFIIVLIVWLFCENNQTILAQSDPVKFEIKSHRAVKVCGSESEKRIQVSLNIGEVKAIDSLYSFDFILQFDTSKIKFETGLYVNTLAEFFEYKGVNVDSPGYLRLYAANMFNPQVVGKLPLIAFEGYYKDDCPDSIRIKLIYKEIEVSKDLRDKIDFNQSEIIIPVEIKITENSFVESNFLIDSLFFEKKDSVNTVICNLNTNNLKNVNEVDLNIQFLKNQSLELSDIKVLHENLKLSEKQDLSDNIYAKYKWNATITGAINNENIIELVWNRKRNEFDTLKVLIFVDSLNSCTCANSIIGDSIYIIVDKDTIIDDTVSVVYDNRENNIFNINGYYNYKNNEFIINSDYLAEKIKLYDLVGNLVKVIECKNELEHRIMLTNINHGVYIVNVLLKNGFENNIVLIKN